MMTCDYCRGPATEARNQTVSDGIVCDRCMRAHEAERMRSVPPGPVTPALRQVVRTLTEAQMVLPVADDRYPVHARAARVAAEAIFAQWDVDRMQSDLEGREVSAEMASDIAELVWLARFSLSELARAMTIRGGRA